MSVVLPRPQDVSPAVQRVRMARLCGHAPNLAQETVRKRTGAASIENLRIETFAQVRREGAKKTSARPRELSVADAAPGGVPAAVERSLDATFHDCSVLRARRRSANAIQRVREALYGSVAEGRTTPKTVE